MLKTLFTTFLLLAHILLLAQNQPYNLVIKGGHVIDPKNNIDGPMDVAIKEGKIALVAKNIDPKQGLQVVDAKGLYVTPGLIDIHTHHFYGTNMDQTYMNGPNAFPPDGFTFRNGVTTVVDAGSPGWRTFPIYKRQTIDASKTRVLAFLNISGEGMRGGNYEQNTNDMDSKLSANTARQYKDYIVGFKVAHFEGPDWTPVDRAVEAGKLAGGLPVMIDFGGSNPPLSIEELFFKHLRPGDIFTHAFGQLASREAIVDINTKKVKPFVWEAQKRGIVFDVGYGGISFAFSQAVPALASKFYPNTISTDIHIGSMNESMKDMLTTMSKFLAMGMDLQSVIKASSWTPAQVIKHEELGHLSVGAPADLAVLGVRKGKFGLFDYTGYKIDTDKKLECELTIRDGKVVYNLNGITTPVVLPRTATTSRPATH
ncbi:amidohydrolase/deacetylase family metallohydrolase [Adhaeribacter arboris]|uniref:Amidohydrolase/deacetylase family metallohydrolase n=1 Tax=Adhaeribacter arboris TaxID=2072846 RepID=A0A2T2YJM7_9BACT|nr:amidohydrolase/deacetylase family metallohydrolase [Adhaeribacter arboris]PSR55710.1 amidohydrolase/deacetylase family metallohydrolase [Adhaeribacter arboris]